MPPMREMMATLMARARSPVDPTDAEPRSRRHERDNAHVARRRRRTARPVQPATAGRRFTTLGFRCPTSRSRKEHDRRVQRRTRRARRACTARRPRRRTRRPESSRRPRRAEPRGGLRAGLHQGVRAHLRVRWRWPGWRRRDAGDVVAAVASSGGQIIIDAPSVAPSPPRHTCSRRVGGGGAGGQSAASGGSGSATTPQIPAAAGGGASGGACCGAGGMAVPHDAGGRRWQRTDFHGRRGRWRRWCGSDPLLQQSSGERDRRRVHLAAAYLMTARRGDRFGCDSTFAAMPARRASRGP